MFTKFICLFLGGLLGVCNVGGISRYDYDSANVVVENTESLDLEEGGEMLELGVDLFEVDRPVSGGSCEVNDAKFYYEFPLGLFEESGTPDCGFMSLDGGVSYYFSSWVSEDLDSENYEEIMDGVYEFVDEESLERHVFGGVNWRVCETPGASGHYLIESDWDWDFDTNEYVIDRSDHLKLDEFVRFCNSFRGESF